VVKAADNGLPAPGFASGIAHHVRNCASKVSGRTSAPSKLAVASPSTDPARYPGRSNKEGIAPSRHVRHVTRLGLRRSELAAVTMKHVQMRDSRWCIVDLVRSMAACGRFRCRHRRKMRLTYRRRKRESRKGFFSGRSTYSCGRCAPSRNTFTDLVVPAKDVGQFHLARSSAFRG
jgi:hypothetical protein